MKFQRSNILEKIFQQCSYLHYIFLEKPALCFYIFLSAHLAFNVLLKKNHISNGLLFQPMSAFILHSDRLQTLQMLVVFIYITACRQFSHWSLQTLQSYQFRKKNHFSFCFQTIDFLSTAHTFWLLHTMMQTFQSLLTLYLTC